MGKRKVKEYTAEFKTKVVLEVLKQEQTQAEIAQDAMAYNFHPSQKIKQEDDGSVTVRFKASGDKEIIWHVFKWGKHCKILAPKSLKKEYEKYLKENLENFK